MTRREQLVLLAFAGAVVVGAVTLIYVKGREIALESTSPSEFAPSSVPSAATAPPAPRAPVDPPPAPEAPSPVSAALTEPAFVSVSAAGEVSRPAVYMLPDGSRVRDLIVRAGGATEKADVSDINLAGRLIDGSTLTIPARREPGARVQPAAVVNPPHYTISNWQPAPPPVQPHAPLIAAAASAPPAAESGGLICLNTATQQQLETLPGIGPKLAGEIIAYRSRSRFASVDELINVSGIGPKRFDAVRHLVTVR